MKFEDKTQMTDTTRRSREQNSLTSGRTAAYHRSGGIPEHWYTASSRNWQATVSIRLSVQHNRRRGRTEQFEGPAKNLPVEVGTPTGSGNVKEEEQILEVQFVSAIVALPG